MKKNQTEITNQEAKKVEVARCSPDIALGLTREQVEQRLQAGLRNEAVKPEEKTVGSIIKSNLFTYFNLVFAILACLLVAAGSYRSLTFLPVVIANMLIGIIQEIRAKKVLDELTMLNAPKALVIRDGKQTEIPAEELVLDDIVLFRAGNQVCADAVVQEGNAAVNESLLTGEPDELRKGPGDTLMSGSFLVSGECYARLDKVGADSYISRLTLEAKAMDRKQRSEMLRVLDKLVGVMGIIIVPLGILLFVQQFVFAGASFQSSIVSMVAAVIGMIPEGLYLLTSVAMAASALKLSRKKVLVQDMNCIERLARVDVLCVDKTGTITEPEMEMENLVPLTDDPPEYLEHMLGAMYQEPDNATARAIHVLFPQSPWQVERRVPFSPVTKWSAMTAAEEGTFLVGAPSTLMGSRFGEIGEKVKSWTDLGSRVLLAAAYEGDLGQRVEEENLRPLALLILTSPLRPGARETFSYFESQGVSLRVISGDDPATAAMVAQRAGIAGADRYVDASRLESPGDYARAVEEYNVFGRVRPEQKRELVAALQRQGHTVAMTGDGVNDLLAMKQADCSVAMGSGAQAASQLASLVLLNSDFSAMPGIVAEGRRVINNIQRAATLFLVKNIFSLALSLVTVLLGWPYPLQPIHLTVISALTIGIPSFFLAMEPNYERVEGAFLPGVLRRAFPGGLTNVFAVVVCQAFRKVFGLPGAVISTVCAGILAVVGMMVLFQVCKRFNLFRGIIWSAMAVCLVLVFTQLGEFFELWTGTAQAKLLLITLLLMTPTVFFAMQRLFDWGERVFRRAKALAHRLTRKRKRHADI